MVEYGILRHFAFYIVSVSHMGASWHAIITKIEIMEARVAIILNSPFS